MTEYEALKKAVELAGGQSALAVALTEKMGIKVRQGQVWKWLNYGKRLPERYALYAEQITAERGQRIKASDFCHVAFSAAS